MTFRNLNRMTDSPGSTTYQNDLLGNRTGLNPSGLGSTTSYQWDAVNRMKYFTPGIGHIDYKYRADGMRAEKAYYSDVQHEEGEPDPGLDYVAQYAYDGQMPAETYQLYSDDDSSLTRHGIGARGIDFIGYTLNGGSEAKHFPIYDGHGNQVALIHRDGTGFVCDNRRAYDYR